ncbi:TolC family protein [Geobacter grbiciae]|uniref:TolC family protein n=1 Tax=Geobacter grbiciae TaxID=155042 RepID=UPI001C019DBD|nr:TolC family protein [Geobacter grbiciae]MBT1077287.1 TolC family protein [Geobacter grbiciae]
MTKFKLLQLKYRVLLAIGMLSFMLQSPVFGESLEDAWKTAVEANHALKSAHSNSLSAEIQVSAAKASRLPVVELSSRFVETSDRQSLKVDLMGQQLRIPITEQGMSLHQAMVTIPLFTSGRITHGISAASSAAEAAKLSEATSESDLKLQVAEAYVNVLRAIRGYNVAKSHEQSLEAHKKDVDNLAEQGMVARNAQLAVEVALLDAQQQMVQAENAQNLAKAAYNRLLSRPLDQAVEVNEIAPEQPSQDLTALNAQALGSRTEPKMIEKQTTALLDQAVVVSRETWPQIGLTGGYQYLQNQYLAPEGQWLVAVGLKWNIFDGWSSRNRASALGQQASAVTEQKKETLSLISLQVRKSWLDLKSASKRIEVTQSAITQANENLRVARDRYTNGLSTNTEVLDAETMRTLSETSHANARYDAVMAGIRLKHSVGGL